MWCRRDEVSWSVLSGLLAGMLAIFDRLASVVTRQWPGVLLTSNAQAFLFQRRAQPDSVLAHSGN